MIKSLIAKAAFYYLLSNMACNKLYSLEGKVAVITGSSGGIGAEIAQEFCRLGAQVVINGRTLKTVESIAKKCEEASPKRKKPLMVIGDVVQAESRVKLINDTIKSFGRLDILVNNAGSLQAKPFSTDTDTSRLDAMYNIHLKAPFHLIKLAIPHLEKTKGNIINISTCATLRTFGTGNLEYSVVKAGVDHMTRFAALELGPKGIRANSINPGATATSLLTASGLSPEEIKKIYDGLAEHHALNRVATVQDISHLAAFLASDASAFITGVLVPIDGGSLLKSPFDFKAP